MAKTKRILSLFVVALMTVFTVLSYVPAKAATAAPKLSVVTQPAAEYTPDQTISFTVNAHYAGKVMYRVILYNGTTKTTSNLWYMYPGSGYYYTKWTPSGTMNFNIHWSASQLQPGYYSMTVLAKKVGSKAKYDTYVDTHSFKITEKTATISSIADVTATVDEGGAYTLPATVSAKMSDDTTKDVAVVWTPATVDTTKVGDQTFTGKVEGYDKDVKLTLTVKAVPLAVTSVSAINATQMEVKFNKPVSSDDVTTNYNTLFTVGGTAASSATLSDDSLTATVNFASGVLESTNSAVIVNPVKSESDDTVLTPRYVTLLTYTDTVSPSVTEIDSSTNSSVATQVTIKFSEPIASVGTVKIDGVKVATTGFTAGDDSVIITGLSLDATKSHTAEVLGLTDEATKANVVADLTQNFTVTTDKVAPTATVTASGDHTLLVTFSKSMNATSVTTALAAGTASSSLVKDETLGNLANDAATVVANTDNKQFSIKVTASLYSNVKTSRALTLVLPGTMTDSLGNAFAATTKTVALAEDTVAPAITGATPRYDSTGKVTGFKVTVNEGMKGMAIGDLIPSNTNVIIVSSNGVLVPTTGTGAFLGGLEANTTAIADGDTSFVIPVKTPATMTGVYNISFAKGLVTDTAQTPNDSVAESFSINFGAATTTNTFTLAPASVSIASNVITVNYANAVKGGGVNGSATILSNYTLNGSVLPTGTTITLESTQKQATITLPANSIATDDAAAVFTIRNVQQLTGETIVPFTKTVGVLDNTSPVLTSAKVTSDEKLVLGFSESLKTVPATADIAMIINGTNFDLTGASFTAGTGSDAGKYVLDLTSTTSKIDTDAAGDVLVDFNGDGIKDAADIVLKAGPGAALTDVDLMNNAAVSAITVKTASIPTTVDNSTLGTGNALTGSTTLTVK